jgi:hypothetical protein
MSVKGAVDAVKASRTAKLAGGAVKWLGKGNVVTAIATILVGEIISRAMNETGGDPEAAVERILAAGQQKAQVEAIMKTSQGVEEQESLAEHYRGLRPDRTLTAMALQQRDPSSREITPDRTPVLEYISKKLGMTPDDLKSLSSPSRMGDYSELQTVLPVSERGN